MKSLGSGIRFVAVSASVSAASRPITDSQVPNVEDVARWFGDTSAKEATFTGVWESGVDASTTVVPPPKSQTPKLDPMAKVFRVSEG